MTQPTFRDAELLSTYLDGKLSQVEFARLESRLKTDPQLASVYRELSQSRALLRQLPARRAPRNFTLTPKMAGIKPPLPRSFPIFRLASALAAILFFFTYAANLSAPAWAAIRAVAPAPAFGRGGGGADPALELAPVVPEAPAAAAPAPATQDNVAPLPTEDLRIAAAPTEMAAEPGAEMKILDPAETQLAPEMQPIQTPVSPWLQMGLLALAVISGGTAYFMRLRSDQNWFKSRALQPEKISPREIFLLVLAVLAVIVLAVSIYWIATTTFYAPVPQAMQYPSGPTGGGDKGSIMAGSSDKGGTPTNLQSFTLTPDMGYNFSTIDAEGRITAVDFPADAFAQETPILYIPGLNNIPPAGVNVFPAYAFTLLPSPKSAVLQAPITISLDYDENLTVEVDENALLLYWWSGEDWRDAANTCEPVSTYEHLPDTNRIRVPVCQMGLFMLVAP